MTNDNHDSDAHGSTLRLALRRIDEKRAAAFRAAERDHAFDFRNLLRDAIARVEAMEAKLVEARADAPEADDHKPDSIPVAELAEVLGCDANATEGHRPQPGAHRERASGTRQTGHLTRTALH